MLKTDLDTFINRMKSYRRALSKLTSDNEAMALMNLSILKEAPWYYNAPLRREILACHDEVEELLDSYLLEARTVLVRAENLVVKVRRYDNRRMLKSGMCYVCGVTHLPFPSCLPPRS
jgi:hypothetical protein